MKYIAALAGLSFLSSAFANDILRTDGFSRCAANADFEIRRLDIQYDKQTRVLLLDVAGSSNREQEVEASLIVTAFGREVFKRDFDPCDEGMRIDQLCPLPEGAIDFNSPLQIPEEFASQIPDIAFNIPNLDGQARLEIRPRGSTEPLACIQSVVNNGKNIQVPAVSYVGVGIAGAALVVTGLTALAAGGAAGSATPSPTFSETVGWFQSIAMNGMLNVQYPSVYRSFSENFAFSTGLIPWRPLQNTIEDFRRNTGGNLTESSVVQLGNTTLVFQPDTINGATTNVKRAAGEALVLFARQVQQTANGTSEEGGSSFQDSKFVQGVKAYTDQLLVPDQNAFMTIFLVFAIVIAAIIVGILLFKVILEAWALGGKFPEKLKNFRKQYWWLMATTISNLIFVLYGVWTLYCVYQFVNGDSWGPKVVAGVTFGIFTAVLVFFTFKIWSLARKSKKAMGDSSDLFEDKEKWRKYSVFYGDFKKNYWWVFIPTIIYMFAKAVVIGAAPKNGMVQVAAQIAIEAVMLVLLLWSRPYALKAGSWINITIQIVRVLSIVCILVFVTVLGVSQTTQTILGVALVVVQAVLTGLLAILIAVNGIILCCRKNPHRMRRKQQEKPMSREIDALTPLDARNSLLLDPSEYKDATGHAAPIPSPASRDSSASPHRLNPYSGGYAYAHNRSTSDTRTRLLSDVGSAGGAGYEYQQRYSDRVQSPERAPRLPDVEPTPATYGAYRPGGY